MYLTQPALPLLSAEFGLTPARAGLSISAVAIRIAVASSFYGPLSDNLGRKRVMVGSGLLLAGGRWPDASAPARAAPDRADHLESGCGGEWPAPVRAP